MEPQCIPAISKWFGDELIGHSLRLDWVFDDGCCPVALQMLNPVARCLSYSSIAIPISSVQQIVPNKMNDNRNQILGTAHNWRTTNTKWFTDRRLTQTEALLH